MRDRARKARGWSAARRAARAARAPACLLSLLLPLLCGCLGPFYHHPDIPPPAAWTTSSDAAAPEWPDREWWHGFDSPDLDELIGQAQHANDDLRAAVARVHQADAQRRIAGAPLLPAVNAEATATRARQPVLGEGYATGNAFSPLLSASYELDFFGHNRALYAAATASAKASRFDRTTVELVGHGRRGRHLLPGSGAARSPGDRARQLRQRRQGPQGTEAGGNRRHCHRPRRGAAGDRGCHGERHHPAAQAAAAAESRRAGDTDRHDSGERRRDARQSRSDRPAAGASGPALRSPGTPPGCCGGRGAAHRRECQHRGRARRVLSQPSHSLRRAASKAQRSRAC